MDADTISSLASVLVSRLMFNLRESGEHSATSTMTMTASSPPSSILSRALTDVEDVDEDVVHESLNCQRNRPNPVLQVDVEIDSVVKGRVIAGHEA